MNTKSLVVAGVLALAAIMAFAMLSRRTLDSHECFVSVTAREVLNDGHWVLPTCNGTPRINKTPLSYWLVAGFGKITGTINEFTARFPSAAFAFLSAACLLYFVNRFLTFRIAAISTTVWVTTLCYFRASHIARPDMALAFFVMICFMAFYAAIISQSRRQQVLFMLIFWVSLALGMLAKGPAPLTYVFIPIFFYIAAERKWRVIPKSLPFVGSLIFLAIVLPWPLAIAQKMHWNLTIWKLEFVDRLYGEYAPGNYPIYFYFYMIFKFIAPWVVLLPVALVAPFYSIWEKKQPVMKFLWFWFVVGFIFLTIDAGKRQHYLFPIVPAVAVLIGIVIEDLVFVKKAFAPKLANNLLLGQIIAIIILVIADIVFIGKKYPAGFIEVVVLGIVAMVGIAVAASFAAKAKPAVACVVAFTSIFAWAIVFYATFWIATDIDNPARQFAKTVVEIIPKSDRLVAYQHVSSRFVQYFGKTVPEITNLPELYKYYEQGDWVICGSSYINALSDDNRFRTIYKKDVNPGDEKEDAGGVIFHKTAPARRDFDKPASAAGPISSKDG